MEHRPENIASASRMQTVEEKPSTDDHALASAAPAASLCAGHVQQFGGASPPANLMEVKA